MADEQKAIDPELTPIHVLSQAFKQDAAEDHRLAAIDLINQKTKQDKIGDATTGTQWAPLVFSILGRNYEGALEAWNGGRKTYSDAFGPDGVRYKQERNSRGSTGTILDAEGNPLNEEQLKEVTKKGWVVSKEDMTAAGLGQFKATNEGVYKMRKAPYEQVVGAYQKASDQATASSGIANQWNELEKIAERSRNSKTGISWLDIYNKLPPEQRAKLSAAANVQIQSASGSSKERSANAGASAGNQATISETKGAEVGGGGGLGVPPGGSSGSGKQGIAPNISGSVSGSNAASAAGQVGATAGNTAANATSASSGVNQQAGFRNIVESIFQGKMDDKEYADFQRFIQLNDSLNAAQATRKGGELAPGSENLGQIDPLLSGQKNTAITATKGMQNEALLSEWSHFLADKMNSSGSRMPGQAELVKEFEDSEKYKAIKYRYGSKAEAIRMGRDHEPKEGDVSVNNRNQLIVYRDGKWRDKK